MLELVVVNDNPQPCLISNTMDEVRMHAENIRLMVFILAAMNKQDITAADWNTLLDTIIKLCNATENLANIYWRE